MKETSTSEMLRQSNSFRDLDFDLDGGGGGGGEIGVEVQCCAVLGQGYHNKKMEMPAESKIAEFARARWKKKDGGVD